MKKLLSLLFAVCVLAVSASEFRLIPTPEKVTFKNEITLSGTAFTLENNIPGFDPAEMLTDHLADYGIKVTKDKAPLKIRFVNDQTDGWLKKYKESYRLKIDKRGITVNAAGIDGAWRGAGRVLSILCGPDTKIAEEGVTLPEMDLADRPDLDTRAMKIEFPTTTGEELHRLVKPVIRSVAMFGFNVIFLDFRGNLECKKHPELAQPPVLLQSDLAEFIRYSRACGLEVMPWTNSIGHIRRAPLIFPLYGKSTSGWERKDKDVPVAMDITHPDFYKVLFDFFDEVFALFGSPRYFEVGCDEFHDGMKILMEKSGKSFPVLFSDYINEVEKYMSKRNCKAIFAQDMFFPHQTPWYLNGPANGPADASQTFDLISKKTSFIMWKYGFSKDYPHLNTLKEKGFEDVWAAPWYDPVPTANLCKQTYKRGLKLLGTTWWTHPQQQGIPTVGEFAWNAANPKVRPNSYYDAIIDHYYFSGNKSLKKIQTTPAEVLNGKELPENFAAQYTKVSPLFKAAKMFDAPELLIKEIPQPWDFKKIAAEEKSIGVTFGTCPLIQVRDKVGINKVRDVKELTFYTPEYGKTTRTNVYGAEVAVVNGVVTKASGRAMDIPEFERGAMAIPADGVVFSFHGKIKPVAGRLTRNLYVNEGMAVKLYKMPDPAIKKTTAKALIARFSGKKPNVRVYVSTIMPVVTRASLSVFRTDTVSGRGKNMNFTANRLLSGDAPRLGNFTFSAVKTGNDNINPVICIEYRAKSREEYPVRMVFTALKQGASSGFTVLGAEEFD